MSERTVEVKVVKTILMCEECKLGEMLPTGGTMLMTSPPQMPHRCNQCKAKTNISGTSYPRIRYEDIVPEETPELDTTSHKPKYKRLDRVQHIVSGKKYVIFELPNHKKLENSWEPYYEYQCELTKQICLRCVSEMEDGRFRLILND